MNISETFKGENSQQQAQTRLAELMKTEEKIKKIDLRSYQGGHKLIFRTKEPDNVEE